MTIRPRSLISVLDFLWHEADLLDRWELEAWAALFTDDGRYIVPSTDEPGGDPDTNLMLIDDDRSRISSRVKRLLSRDAHADYPRPRTRHLGSNVRILEKYPDGALAVTASFIVHSFRVIKVNVFIGQFPVRACSWTRPRLADSVEACRARPRRPHSSGWKDQHHHLAKRSSAGHQKGADSDYSDRIG